MSRLSAPLAFFALIPALLLCGCTSLLELRRDLREIRDSFGQASGTLISPECPTCPVILASFGDQQGKTVHTYRVYESPGPFLLTTLPDSRYLFAFNDINGDFEHQPGEPSAWIELPAGFSASQPATDLSLTLTPWNNRTPPAMPHLFDLRGMSIGTIDVAVGTIAALDDPRFDPVYAYQGMWQPLHFMRAGHAGIYFLEPYDPRKTPVIFIHGIGGSPRDFATVIARLDRDRFQPWLPYYPSGIDLQAVGDGLRGMIAALHHQYRFEHMHVVAHSMGGLVAYDIVSGCARSHTCGYLRKLVTLSTPFGGRSDAQTGVDRSPVVMPVWRSIAPQSAFLQALFSARLPEGVDHHLLFGFRNDDRFGGPSSDGTVPLSSQLQQDAQRQAASLRGFDYDHMGMITAPEVVAHVLSLLTSD